MLNNFHLILLFSSIYQYYFSDKLKSYLIFICRCSINHNFEFIYKVKVCRGKKTGIFKKNI